MRPQVDELSPYVGTGYFERTERDRKRFFGRDREIEELAALVLANNLVLVYAASGAGKTSLLNAGVIPRLVAEGFEVLPRGRVRPDAVAEGHVNPYELSLLCSISPGAKPESLAGRPLADHLRSLPRPERATGRVLVIDQAEELFTFAPTDWREHQKAFIVALRDAVRDAPDLRIIIVTREDYLSHFDDFASLLPGGLHVRFHLEPLLREAARRAVEGPLGDTRRRFAEGVAEQLVNDLARVQPRAGAGGAPKTRSLRRTRAAADRVLGAVEQAPGRSRCHHG